MDETKKGDARQWTLEEDHAGGRLDKALSQLAPDLSRTRVKGLILDGAVTRNGEPVTTPNHKVRPGDRLELVIPEPATLDVVPEEIPLDIVYEDRDLVVIDKPPGLVVHPGAGVSGGTLVNALLHHCDNLSGIGGVIRPGIVHRIDKETSGLLVVAKNDAAHHGLATQFEDHSIHRRYLALVRGCLKGSSGKVDAPIGRHPQNRQKMAVNDRGKRAVTHWQVITRFDPDFTLIHCELETGRTHQIRVHLAHIGHPLLGDPVYGRRYNPPKTLPDPVREAILAFERQALHAELLGFIHPGTGETMKFTAPPPGDLQGVLDALRGE